MLALIASLMVPAPVIAKPKDKAKTPAPPPGPSDEQRSAGQPEPQAKKGNDGPVRKGAPSYSPGEGRDTAVAGLDELTGLRSARGRAFRFDGASHVAQVFPGPVNYRGDDGAFHPIDSNLVAVDGGYRNAANSFTTFFPQTMSATSPVRIDHARGFIATSVLGADQSSADVSGATATYVGARPFTDLVYTATATGYKEAVVLKDPRASNRTTYAITTDLELELRDDNQVFAYRDGSFVAALPAPWAEDSSEDPLTREPAQTYDLDLDLRATGPGSYQLMVELDRAWLDDPLRVFPVIIDPTFVFSDADPGVRQLHDTAPDSRRTPTSPPYNHKRLSVGRRQVGPDLFEAQTYTVFDLREQVRKMGHLIYSADLDLYNIMNDDAQAHLIELRRIREPWDAQSLTWANKDIDAQVHNSVWATHNACGENPDCTGWHRWDIEDLTQWWIDNPIDTNTSAYDPGETALGSNHGFRLSTPASNGIDGMRFVSMDAPSYDPSEADLVPYMVVVVNAQPSSIPFTMQAWEDGDFPHVGLPDGVLDGGVKIATTTPTLEVEDLTDHNDDPIVVRFQVATDDSDFEASIVYDSDWIDETHTHKVPNGALAGAQTYYWRVQAADVCDDSSSELVLCDPKDQGWPTSEVREFEIDLDPKFRGVDHRWAMWSTRLGNGIAARVNQATGNLAVSYPLDSLDTPAGTLALKLTYNSHAALDGTEKDFGLGAGWKIAAGPSSDPQQLPLRIDEFVGAAEVVYESGRRDLYVESSNGVYATIGPLAGTLRALRSDAQNPDVITSWRLTTYSGGIFTFDDNGWITQARPSSATPTQPGFDYAFDANQRIESVAYQQGTLTQSYTFDWSGSSGADLEITSSAGPSWELDKGSLGLASVIDPTGAEISFGYDSSRGLVDAITDGTGATTTVAYQSLAAHPDAELVQEVKTPGASQPWRFEYLDGSDQGSAVFTRRVADTSKVTDPRGVATSSDDDDFATLTDFSTVGLPIMTRGPAVAVQAQVQWPVTLRAWDQDGNLTCERAPLANTGSGQDCLRSDGLQTEHTYQQRAPHLLTQTTAPAASDSDAARADRLVTTYEYDEGFRGLQAQFFDDPELEGLPDALDIFSSFPKNWGSGSPPGTDGDFSARYLGEFFAAHASGTETYSFRVTKSSGDGARIATGEDIEDCWTDGQTDCDLEAELRTGWQPIVLEFSHRSGQAGINLQVKAPGSSSYQTVVADEIRPDTDVVTATKTGVVSDLNAYAVTTYTYDDSNARLRGLPDEIKTRGSVSGGPTANTTARTTSYTYDDLGRVVTETDGTNKAITHTYGSGANAHCVIETIDREGLEIDRTCDGAGDVTSESSIVEGAERETAYTYDALGRLTETKALIGSSLKTLSKTTYDAAGRTKTEQIWASGTEIRQSAYTYDYLSSDPDHALKTTTTLPDPDYGGPRTAQTEQRFYDDVGSLVELIDARSHTTTHTYDARNQRRSTTDAAQDDWSYDYDLAGNRTATVDPAGVTTERSFDFLSRKVSATIVGTNGQSLPPTTWERDARGDVTKRTEPDGSYVKRTYDAFGGVLQETAPVGPGGSEATRSYTYDPDSTGFLVAATDFKNNTTTYGHDDMGRMTTVSLPRGANDPPSATTYTYNPAGELTGVSIPTLDGEAPVTWAFGHDQLGRTDEVTDGVSKTTTTTFNRAGEAIEVDDPRGLSIAMSYDAWGNLTSRAATETATANPVPGSTETFTYGPYGNLKSADNQHASITATYDGLVRLATVTVDSELTTDHTYQDARLVATTDAAGTTTYAYDSFGRPASVTDAVTQSPTTYSYDQAQLESRSDPAGLHHAYSYDPAGRVDEEVVVRTTQGQSSEVVRFESTYDKNSRVTTRLSEVEGSADQGQWSYDYDPAGRLTGATDPTGARTTYTYDGAFNRIAVSTDPDPDSGGDEITTTTTYDSAARPTASSDGTTYHHDASGNLTGIDTPAQGFSFTYDPYVRLIGATASAGGTDTFTHIYAHDALDRTITKTTDALSPLGAERISEQTTTYTGLGEVLALRTTEQVAASTVVATTTETYGYALEGPVALQTAVATTIPEETSATTLAVLGAGPHTDLNYTADPSGVITGTKTYDPWGTVRTDSTASDGGLGFQSDPTDPDTGLTDMGARHYLADLGRFTTPDPYPPSLGNPASFNPYIYGLNDPVSRFDPTGMISCDDQGNCRPDDKRELTMVRDARGTPRHAGTKGMASLVTIYMNGSSEVRTQIARSFCATPCMPGSREWRALDRFIGRVRLAQVRTPCEGCPGFGEFLIGAAQELSGFNDLRGCIGGSGSDCLWLATALPWFKGIKLAKYGDEIADATRGARFVVNRAGEALDVARVTIPQGKFGYLLKDPSKAGVFRESLGFTNSSLGSALQSHLVQNFGSASASRGMVGGGAKFSVAGPITGPSGQTWNITSVWGVDPDGLIRLITATP